MRDFTILHVGDLHFDDLRAASADIDAKDEGITRSLQAVISGHPLQTVMKPMAEQAERADAVLFVGDLSSYGNLDVYVDAVKYLHTALALPDRALDRLHAVVGNHDVDRDLVYPGDRMRDEILAKFDPLTDAWAAHSLPILAPGEVRRSEIADGSVGLEVFSMNSCVACGEYRDHVFDEALEKELTDRAAGGDKSARDTLFEQMDAPAFFADHVSSVSATVREMRAQRVPVILAHHNVLPQFQPRLQVYAEMVNAGMARAQLAGCGRPVIYLHGHIHDDPVEVVEQYHPRRGRLIAVSAPQVQYGFNVITVSFGQRNLALGATITPWRYAHGEVRAETPVKVFLRRADQENHEATADILRVMARAGHTRYSNFIELYRGEFGDARSEEELGEALVEADWAGLLRIDNLYEDRQHWTIRSPLL